MIAYDALRGGCERLIPAGEADEGFRGRVMRRPRSVNERYDLLVLTAA